MAVITYSVIHFRAKPDDDSDGLPLHGSTGLEIVWTAFPAVLVTAISIIGRRHPRPERATPAPTRCASNVTAQQFIWTFSYPEQGNIVSPTLNLPVDRTVELQLTARDVIHSFWVPEFSQKRTPCRGSRRSS